MWWTSEITSKKAVLVRYTNVHIVDRRAEEDYNTQVDDLYGMEVADKVTCHGLKNDPVWKGLVEKFDRLGYDLLEPEMVTRIEKSINVGSEFCWDFDNYDREQRAKEQDGVLCLPS